MKGSTSEYTCGKPKSSDFKGYLAPIQAATKARHSDRQQWVRPDEAGGAAPGEPSQSSFVPTVYLSPSAVPTEDLD